MIFNQKRIDKILLSKSNFSVMCFRQSKPAVKEVIIETLYRTEILLFIGKVASPGLRSGQAHEQAPNPGGHEHPDVCQSRQNLEQADPTQERQFDVEARQA